MQKTSDALAAVFTNSRGFAAVSSAFCALSMPTRRPIPAPASMLSMRSPKSDKREQKRQYLLVAAFLTLALRQFYNGSMKIEERATHGHPLCFCRRRLNVGTPALLASSPALAARRRRAHGRRSCCVAAAIVSLVTNQQHPLETLSHIRRLTSCSAAKVVCPQAGRQTSSPLGAARPQDILWCDATSACSASSAQRPEHGDENTKEELGDLRRRADAPQTNDAAMELATPASDQKGLPNLRTARAARRQRYAQSSAAT